MVRTYLYNLTIGVFCTLLKGYGRTGRPATVSVQNWTRASTSRCGATAWNTVRRATTSRSRTACTCCTRTWCTAWRWPWPSSSWPCHPGSPCCGSAGSGCRRRRRPPWLAAEAARWPARAARTRTPWRQPPRATWFTDIRSTT